MAVEVALLSQLAAHQHTRAGVVLSLFESSQLFLSGVDSDV